MRILIRADSSIAIGTGHIMRYLTLAESLRGQGADVFFVSREEAGHCCDIIQQKKFKVFLLPGKEHFDAAVDAELTAAVAGDGPDCLDGKACRAVLEKLADLRIFPDDAGRFNLGLRETGGELLIVSQFTLYVACRKGRRPSFIDAALPEAANALYEKFVECVRSRGIEVATGEFQTHMVVSLSNDGPVTLIVDSPSGESPCA